MGAIAGGEANVRPISCHGAGGSRRRSNVGPCILGVPVPGSRGLAPSHSAIQGQRYRPAWEHDRFPALSGHFQRYAKPWFSVCRPTTEMGQFPGVSGPGFIITQRPLGRLPSRLLSLMVRPSAPWPTLELRGRIKYGGAYSTAMYPNSMARCRAIKASRASSNRRRNKPS